MLDDGKANMITIEKYLMVRDYDIELIMYKALEPDGIDYWCDEVEIIDDPYIPAEVVCKRISTGGKLRLHAEGDVNDYPDSYNELTKEMLLKGIKLASEKGVKFVYDGAVCCCIDRTAIDERVADLIVQYALFGKIIYSW